MSDATNRCVQNVYKSNSKKVATLHKMEMKKEFSDLQISQTNILWKKYHADSKTFYFHEKISSSGIWRQQNVSKKLRQSHIYHCVATVPTFTSERLCLCKVLSLHPIMLLT